MSRGAEQIYIKLLKPNNNSKNQIYVAGNFDVLQMFPMSEFSLSEGTSEKKKQSSQIMKAQLPLYWISENGEKICPARFATLILYPQYPEIRISGILRGCELAPRQIINHKIAGRILVLGVKRGADPAIYAFALEPDANAAKEANALIKAGEFEEAGNEVLLRLLSHETPEDYIFNVLSNIDFNQAYDPFRLTITGDRIPTHDRNAPGYTLEGLLGIGANSVAGSDIGEWELKTIELKNYPMPNPSARVSLLTAEPDIGLYDSDFQAFMNKYATSRTSSRLNFTGPWTIPKGVSKNLKLIYNAADKEIQLRSESSQELVAGWDLLGLVNHWKNKHQHAAFISYRKTEDARIQFSPFIGLGQGAGLGRFLNAVQSGLLIYDPGVKSELHKNEWKAHKRNQWRTTLKDLPWIYKSFDFFDARTHHSCQDELSESWKRIFGALRTQSIVD